MRRRETRRTVRQNESKLTRADQVKSPARWLTRPSCRWPIVLPRANVIIAHFGQYKKKKGRTRQVRQQQHRDQSCRLQQRHFHKEAIIPRSSVRQ